MKSTRLYPSLLIIWCLLLCSNVQTLAQLSGSITDVTGEPLAFASVYVQGTSRGTTSNGEGQYALQLENGQHQVVFQYVGYQQQIQTITIKNNQPIRLNVALEAEIIELQEAIVSANQEDPAYRVIRQAIAKRKYYRDLITAYTCQAYTKSTIKMDNIPEKLAGNMEINASGISLDTSGYLYLSETRSNLYFQAPNDRKEIVLSSKVSGDDQAFSFNSAQDVDFNFYNSHIEFGRQMISPIANTALSYYRYRLVSINYDKNGRLINKIELIPKQASYPVFQGYIYIVEDSWNIQGLDIWFMGNTANMFGADTMKFKQVYVPVEAPDKWVLFSQILDVGFNFLQFKGTATYTGIHSNYDLNPTFEEKFFSNELFRFQDSANVKSQDYWETIRPIPLTEQESLDYQRKDSLKVIYHSKTYLDSIDNKNNRFKLLDLVGGYTWKNSYQRQSFSINSPITTIQFNPVQGWNVDLDMSYEKQLNPTKTKEYSINGQLNYGFGESKLRGTLAYQHNFNQVTFTRLRVEGGTTVTPINNRTNLSPLVAEFYALMDKQHYRKLYEKTYFKTELRHELFNGLMLFPSIEYADRQGLDNQTNYSWFKKEDTYTPNNPLDDGTNELELPTDYGKQLLTTLTIGMTFDQKYVSYPNRKINYGSKYPQLFATYQRGWDLDNSDQHFDYAAVRLLKSYMPIGLVGYSGFSVTAGTFFNKPTHYIDQRFFDGNQTFLMNEASYLGGFFKLPYFGYTTDDSFVEVHYQHDFEGFILDKIPLLNKLGWSIVGNVNGLYAKGKHPYYEFSLGLNNVGFGNFKFLRLDYAIGVSQNKRVSSGVLVGIDF